MPSATNPESRPPLDAGRILAQSLVVVASNAGAMAMVTVLIHLPILAAQLYLIVVPTVSVRAQQEQFALLMGAGMFLSALSTTAVTHGVFQQTQGKSASFGECLRMGVARTPTILIINLVTLVLMFLGSLAFFLPGLLAATVLFVAAPAAVAEGRGVIGSLRRSVELTRGSRWATFSLLIAPISLVVGLNLMALLALGDVKAEHPLENPRFQAVSSILSVLYQALISVTMAITYCALRLRHQGAEKADLGSALD
jgi:hypothetical protein